MNALVKLIGAARDPHARPPVVLVHDGSLEAIKWLALVLMTVDHVNKYLLHEAHPWMYALGRLAMPLFMLVFTFNLARPGAVRSGAIARTLQRLVVVAMLATPAYSALGHLPGGWWPLNILWTLASIALAVRLFAAGTMAGLWGASLVVLVAGAMVEFWWPALVFGLTAWGHFRTPSWRLLACTLISLASMVWINGNHWALAAVPVAAVVSRLAIRLPRMRALFYLYYPTHLWVIWGASLWGERLAQW